MAKEQDELVKLSQTNEENRGCQMHGLAYLLSFLSIVADQNSSEISLTC